MLIILALHRIKASRIVILGLPIPNTYLHFVIVVMRASPTLKTILSTYLNRLPATITGMLLSSGTVNRFVHLVGLLEG